MTSVRKSASEEEHLAMLGSHVEALQDEVKRLNRRLRNARGAIQAIEDELGTLAGLIERRLTQLSGEP